MSRTDAAYLAALLDGEGSIIALKRPDGTVKSYRVHIANTYFPVLEWCKKVTGLGRVDAVNPQKRAAHHLSCGAWKVHGVKAASVLRQLLPYMQIKKAKALVAIEAMNP